MPTDRHRRLAGQTDSGYGFRMPVYIYETTDDSQPVRQFEIQQSMKDAPFERHPETGEPIRRLISGGYGYMAKGNAPRHADMQRNMGGGSCGGGCACHN